MRSTWRIETIVLAWTSHLRFWCLQLDIKSVIASLQQVRPFCRNIKIKKADVHILSIKALKQQVYVFLLWQRQSHVKYRRKLNFAVLQRHTNVLSGPYGEFQPTPIYKFALFTWLFSVWGWLVVTFWLADVFTRLAAFDLVAVFWPGFLTSPANPAINSPFSCLRRSKNLEKCPTKGRDEVSRVKH